MLQSGARLAHKSIRGRFAAGLATGLLWLPIIVVPAVGKTSNAEEPLTRTPDMAKQLRDESISSVHSVKVGSHVLVYRAEAGVLAIDPKDPAAIVPADKSPPAQEAEAAMSYVAYFLGKEPDPARPITFAFNGGPGASTVWLHMGAFGPKRVVTADHAHTAAPPYKIIANDSSLLPQSDLVFVDAPGTGFGQLYGTDKEKAFFGTDQDAQAFANFIVAFISRHGRWNSPKYLLGESYGTTRAAVLAVVLQRRNIDLNGIILVSQIFSFDNRPYEPQFNPGVDQAYVLVLPSYAATAWYHHKLPNRPRELEPFLADVEQFALGDYLSGLAAGSSLPPDRRAAIVARLHEYTGLPSELLEQADLRINSGVFEQHVLGARTVGRLDARFAGPTIDPIAKESGYDPQESAINPAYVSAFNDYVRRDLKFGADRVFVTKIDVWQSWDFRHQAPGAPFKLPQSTNVIPDLAFAMKANPGLRVQMHGGYFDLATPYFAAEYELRHLAVPPDIAANIEVRRYPSGHMIYAHEPSLIALHESMADFIRRTHAASAAAN